MATSAQVAEFRQANKDLTLLAQSQLQDFLSSFQLSGDPVQVRNALLEFFPELVATYGDVSALLSSDFYDMLRDAPPSAASFRAAYAAPVDAAQAQASTRWAVGPLFDQDEALFLTNILGATQRLVLQRGRDTIFESAAGDPIRTGVARIPRGTKTCKFCIMLASRGAAYSSEVSAELVVGRGSNRTGYDENGKRLTGGIGQGVKARGSQKIAERFHDDCDCETVTIRSDKDWPDGHDVAEFKKLYEAGSGVGRDLPSEEKV